MLLTEGSCRSESCVQKRYTRCGHSKGGPNVQTTVETVVCKKAAGRRSLRMWFPRRRSECARSGATYTGKDKPAHFALPGNWQTRFDGHFQPGQFPINAHTWDCESA